MFRGDWLDQVQMPKAVGAVIGCYPLPLLHVSLHRAWGLGQQREGEGGGVGGPRTSVSSA